jgi:hypothetical protein
MSDTSEQKLNQIKEDFLLSMQESILSYIREYLDDAQSSESYQSQSAHMSKIYAYKRLIEKYFPEINVKDTMEDFKEQALEKVQQEPYYCHDERLFKEMQNLFNDNY